jgi:hypothetical protein
MYTNFDYIEEKQNMEEKFNQFFGEFSSEIRNKLMSKNLTKPQNLYDIFYPSIKKDLLSKNVNQFNTDLDNFSEQIRNEQMAKAVEKIFSLEEESEEFRKSLLARKKLHKDITDLLTLSEGRRKELLSKNTLSLSDLMKESELQRNKNIAKNKINPNLEKEINDNQNKYREQNLSNNSSKKQDLLSDSKDFIKDDLSHNALKKIDLEEESKKFKNNNLALNKSKDSDLAKNSVEYRKEDLSHNTLKENDLESYSKKFRENDLSNNNSKNFDLEKESLQYKKENLSKNTFKHSDLEKDSVKFKNNDLSNNIPKNLDLEKESVSYREKDLSINTPRVTDLRIDSKEFINKNLSVNLSIKHDIEKDSVSYRNENLSYNIKKKTDLDKDSVSYREGDLSVNTPKVTDLEKNSVSYREEGLAANTPKVTDLEKDSVSYREEDLSVNTPKVTDLEKDSVSYREGDLSVNTPKVTDLDKDSVSYREEDLSVNTPKVTDLDKDSVSYREGDLSVNTPKVTDLDKDSVSYREENLSVNTPKVTDLDKDSVSYREENLSVNTPKVTDLDKDSVSYREKELSVNTPKVTDLDKDSVSYREKELSVNVPNNSNLEINSILYRKEDLSANVPNSSDLIKDSMLYRKEDLAANVPNNSDLREISTPFRNDELSANVPSSETIESHKNQYGQFSNSEKEKNLNLSKNVTSHQTIDKHYDQYGGINGGENERIANLNKNVGFGQMGINVLGPGGTSVFVGISGVLTQGLVFRNLLTMRNKYKATSNYYTEGRVLEYGEGGMLVSNTLEVPTQGEILSNNALPINPEEFINSNVGYFAEIKSPIKRNLFAAYSFASSQKEVLKYYNVYDGNSAVVNVNIDYDLDNRKITGKSFGYKQNTELSLPPENINNLIRQYLKYSNPFGLDNKGSLKTTNTDRNIGEIYSKINSLSQSTDYMKSIQDLIISYNAFSEKRINRILNTSAKSLNAPSGTYFIGDVERQFDENYGNIDNANIAFKKYAGNPVHDNGFNTNSKGVRNILRRIGDSDIDSNINFKDIQGTEGSPSKTYVIGRKKDGSKKKGYQKYTVRNPYAPEKAGRLIFCFTNYSIPEIYGRTMFFPPYINSFQNSDSASWNPINYLGRPEAVYTYNNSSRDGSVSFFILTDYAESVTIGNEQNENMNSIDIAITKNFTIDGLGKNLSTELLINSIEATKNAVTKKLQEQKLKSTNESNTYSKINTLQTTETGTTTQNIDESKISENEEKDDETNKKMDIYQSLINKLETTAKQAINSVESIYSESSEKYKNINQFYVTVKEVEDGYVNTIVQDTKTRINEMIKNLAFQPAYFSGSKVDLKNRMEFLSKMTRPANNIKKDGFSFTNPPVCHLRLGDWIDHDIIVNSVSYDYAGAPWTTDLIGGSVQPMWVNVTVSFNIVGGAGAGGGVPLTSTDVEGFYGTKTTRR